VTAGLSCFSPHDHEEMAREPEKNVSGLFLLRDTANGAQNDLNLI